MAVTMARHVESVTGSGAAFVVTTCQGVVEPCSIRRREWSRFAAITAACRVEPVVGSSGAAQNPPQEVEWSRGHYYGLSGNDGAAWNPSQEVEQSCGCYYDLSGGPGLSVEVRLMCLAERSSYPSERSSDVASR